MNDKYTIELFGGLCVRQGEQVVARFRTQKTAALLAYLACFLRRTHPREELIELLWPESDIEAGRTSLRTALASLRRQLEPPGIPENSVLVADRTNVRLNPDVVATDRAEFETALQSAARAADDAARVKTLFQAVALYRGPFLPGFYEDWALRERERLAQQFVGALRDLVAALEKAGDLRRAIEIGLSVVANDPFLEEGHSDLIRLYIATGQIADARRQYRELERILRDELGETPSAATRALVERLGETKEAPGRGTANSPAVRRNPAPLSTQPAASPSPLSTALPASASGAATRGQTLRLPLALTRFFGREEELAGLQQMLQTGDVRLLTLTGPGGAGKTRLAMEVARRLSETLPGAICFVALADLADANLLLKQICNALPVPCPDNVTPQDHIVETLGRQPSLLILDNFEQLVETGSQAVADLLERIPTLTCLVTSRQRLDIGGEQEFPVAMLPVPNLPGTPERLVEFSSVQLFVNRAQAVRPDFQITRQNAATVAALCARLEGNPLAMELAAAWAALLTVNQMLERLERPFDLLTSRRKDLAPRHRTLWNTIAWSYELLNAASRRFFAQLSVFRGGWTLDAAVALCTADPPDATVDACTADPPDAASLSSVRPPESAGQGFEWALEQLKLLQERSLILVEEAGSEMRFRLPETLREFAHAQLSEAEQIDLRRRHLTYYLTLVEKAEANLTGPDQAAWLDRLEREHDNLRAALAQRPADADRSERLLRLAGTLCRFWQMRGYLSEGRACLARILAWESAPAPTAVRAKALTGAAILARSQGDFDAATRFHEQALALRKALGDVAGISVSLNSLGNVAREQGDYAGARALYQQSLAISRETRNRGQEAASLGNLGNVAKEQGDYDEARSLYEQALRINRALGNRGQEAANLGNLGNVAKEKGDVDEARSLYARSLEIKRALGNKQGILITLINLAPLLGKEGDYTAAQGCLAECLALCRELDSKREVAFALEECGTLALSQGQSKRTARLLGAAQTLREAVHNPIPPRERHEVDRTVEAARAALGEQAFQEAWREGRTMSLEQALTYASRPEEALGSVWSSG